MYVTRPDPSIITLSRALCDPELSNDMLVMTHTMITVRNVFSGSLSGNRAPKPKLGNFRAEYAHIMTDLEVLGVSHRYAACFFHILKSKKRQIVLKWLRLFI